MKEEIILVGGGGHCKSCIDVIEQSGAYKIAGIVDVPERVGSSVLGYRIVCSDGDIGDMARQYPNFLIAIGQIQSPGKRITLFNRVKKTGAKLPAIISPLAYVSKHAGIGEGTIVMHHAMVNAGARIGVNCIINSKALVEHDAEIGNHCHVATGAVINGETKVESETFFGSNATTREGLCIGEKSVIAFHTKVKADLPPGSVLK